MNTREIGREREAWNSYLAKTKDPDITPDEKGMAYMEYKEAISFEAVWFENLHRRSPRFLWRGLRERARVYFHRMKYRWIFSHTDRWWQEAGGIDSGINRGWFDLLFLLTIIPSFLFLLFKVVMIYPPWGVLAIPVWGTIYLWIYSKGSLS